MKILILALWTICSYSSCGQDESKNSKKVSLFEDENIKLILHHYLKADLGDSEWLKLEIQNKTDQPIYVEKAEYHIDQEIEAGNGNKRMNYGAFGQANKYDLLHFYHDLGDPSSHKLSPDIKPNSSLFAWKYLTNCASVLIDGTSNIQNGACGFFNINLTYFIKETKREAACTQKQFCFKWKEKEEVPQKKLVKRLREVIKDSHHRWVNTYMTTELMNEPEIVAKIKTDEFINGVLFRKNVMGDEVLLFLKELRNRNAIPNTNLTGHFRSKILSKRGDVKGELLYYWDNELFDDLLNSAFYLLDVSYILEMNSKYWSKDSSQTKKSYAYLKEQMPFNEKMKIDSSNFNTWSSNVKFLAISRSKEFINFIRPYLDDETTFEIEVFADGNRFLSSVYIERETLKVPVRICDIAFVALLRATNQIDFKMGTGMRNISPNIEIKEDVLDTDFISFFEPLANDFYMNGFEEHLRLTPELKKKILELIK